METQHFPKISVVWLGFLWLVAVDPGAGISFSHERFDTIDLADVKIVKEGSWYTGETPYVKDSSIWLTPDPEGFPGSAPDANNLGRVVYKDKVRMMDEKAGKALSFSTNFSLKIITTASYSEKCGSGMTFFLSNTYESPNQSLAPYLGLVDPTSLSTAQFFAVEFDTRATPLFEEFSSSHIGIDINSLKSVSFTDTRPGSISSFYPELFLYSNYTFTAWVDYDSSNRFIRVWMTNSTPPATRPNVPCLEFQYDLSLVLQEYMYVGFTATNDRNTSHPEGHVLYSWSFNVDEFSSGSSSHTFPVLAVAITVSILVAICIIGGCIAIVIYKQKRHKKPQYRQPRDSLDLSFESTSEYYSHNELSMATGCFSEKNRIGVGGSSYVYKGILSDGSIVAVKKLKHHVRRKEEFASEMKIISSIRHRNLLQFKGWCYENDEAMLVYNFMDNGSLDTYIFGAKKGKLSSETRLRILIGVASALEYLHGGLSECVIHRDVKAANVMVTDDFQAMLGDFGLARLIRHYEAVTMTIAGTFGYVAPEILSTGKATSKADVYSYGVLALEVACGRSSFEEFDGATDLSIVDWVRELQEKDDIMVALDKSMCKDLSSSDMEKWRCVLYVALLCCQRSPEKRPTMRQVSLALQADDDEV